MASLSVYIMNGKLLYMSNSIEPRSICLFATAWWSCSIDPQFHPL